MKPLTLRSMKRMQPMHFAFDRSTPRNGADQAEGSAHLACNTREPPGDIVRDTNFNEPSDVIGCKINPRVRIPMILVGGDPLAQRCFDR